MKKLLSIFLVIAMLATTLTVSAARYTDIDGHWAKTEIEAWSDYGVISGYNGEFSPNRYITRGEFAVVLSRLMGYQKESANVFADLPEKFYTSYVLKLFETGVMQGYDGLIRPEDSLTREEASVIICRALGINTADVMNRDFLDADKVSGWAKGYINSMVNTGLLNGADGKLNPQNPIMRAEVVKILDNAVKPILSEGTFDKVDTDKILVVSSGNVTITNSSINGKIIVTQGIVNGNLTFENSKIENTMVIDNDRFAFILLRNTTVTDKSILSHKAFAKTPTGGNALSGGSSGGSSSGSGNNSTDKTHNIVFKIFKDDAEAYSTVKVSNGGTIGAKLPAEPTVEGYIFKGWQDLSGNPVTSTTVIKKSMTLVAQFAIKVTFYEDYGRFAETIGEAELVLDTNGKAIIKDSDFPTTNFYWDGYKASDYMSGDYEGYGNKFIVKPEYWYKENGEWKIFNKSSVITKDTDAYLLFRELSLNAFGTAVVIKYDENSRVMDSAKAFLDKAIPQLEAAKETSLPIYEKITSAILGMLEETNMLDGDKFVKKMKFALNFENALEETSASEFDSVTTDGYFDVAQDNIEILKVICNELELITLDAVFDEDSDSATAAMAALVGYDICEDIFESVKDEYCAELSAAIADVESGNAASVSIPDTLTMVFDPVEDIMQPLYDEAEEKLISSLKRTVDYDENTYLQYLVEELDIFAELMTKVDAGNDERTGYQLKDLITCAEFMTKALIVADDAVCWYDNNDVIGEIYDAVFAETYHVVDKFGGVISDPKFSHKIPDEIKVAFEKMEQIKVLLEDFEQNFMDTVGDYFDSRLDVMFNALLNNNGRIQAKLQELLESGEIYSKIDALKDGPMGQIFDDAFFADVIGVVENIAEHGFNYYKVPTSDETIIDKFEVNIGGYVFTMSRCFDF